MEIVNSSKVLQAETRMLLDGKLLVPSSSAVARLAQRGRGSEPAAGDGRRALERRAKLPPLAPPQSDSPEEEELRLTLNSLSTELHKLDDIHWICPLMQCSEEVGDAPVVCSGVFRRF